MKRSYTKRKALIITVRRFPAVYASPPTTVRVVVAECFVVGCFGKFKDNLKGVAVSPLLPCPPPCKTMGAVCACVCVKQNVRPEVYVPGDQNTAQHSMTYPHRRMIYFRPLTLRRLAMFRMFLFTPGQMMMMMTTMGQLQTKREMANGAANEVPYLCFGVVKGGWEG